MKVVLTKHTCDNMTQSTAQESVVNSIAYLAKRVHGKAGLIAIDKVRIVTILYNDNVAMCFFICRMVTTVCTTILKR